MQKWSCNLLKILSGTPTSSPVYIIIAHAISFENVEKKFSFCLSKDVTKQFTVLTGLYGCVHRWIVLLDSAPDIDQNVQFVSGRSTVSSFIYRKLVAVAHLSHTMRKCVSKNMQPN